MPEISLSLNDELRDKLLIFMFLAERINGRLIRDMYANLSQKSPEEMKLLRAKYAEEELKEIYHLLSDGLNPEGFDQLLRLLNPDS